MSATVRNTCICGSTRTHGSAGNRHIAGNCYNRSITGGAAIAGRGVTLSGMSKRFGSRISLQVVSVLQLTDLAPFGRKRRKLR
jgi:hypothetical protein